MRPVPKAMLWAFWQRGKVMLLLILLLITSLPALIFSMLRGIGQPQQPELSAPLHFGFMLLAIIGCLAVAFSAQGPPTSLRVLPVSNSQLVAWTMPPSVATTSVMYLVMALVMNWAFQANWPLLTPALFMAAATAATQTVLWLAWGSTFLQFLLCWLLAIVLVPWFDSRYGGIGEPRFGALTRLWGEASPADALFLCTVIAGRFATGVVAMARLRRGDQWSLDPLGDWFEQKSAYRHTRQTQFRSAVRAQWWYEWRQKGLLLPVCFAAASILVIGAMLYYRVSLAKWPNGLVALAGPFYLLTFVVAIAVGQCRFPATHAECGSFLGTRPMSDGRLAAAGLWNIGFSLVLTWMLWFVAILTAAILLSLARGDAATLRGLFPWGITEAEAVQSGLPDMLIVWWSLPIAWAVMANVASVLLTGRPRFAVTLFGVLVLAIVALLSANFWLTPDWLPILIALAFALSAACIAGTLVAFAVGVSKELLPPGVAVAAGLLWIAAASVLIIHWQPSEQHIFAITSLAISIGSLFVLPLATTPLAISWNRHR